MYRKLLLAASLAAVTTTATVPAFALTAVKINVAGLDAKAAQSKIWNAAKAACRVEFSNESQVVSYYGFMDCVQETVAAANANPAASNQFAYRSVAAGGSEAAGH